MMEVCNTEVFHPSCAINEVIIIEKAYYGRLELGQCAARDLSITRTATRSCRTRKRALNVNSPGVAAARHVREL